MDRVLQGIVEAEDRNKDEEDALDLSPGGWIRQVLRWRLHNPAHIHLYRLWRGSRGFGSGESLKDIWELSREPGSLELIADFGVLMAREGFIKRRQDRKNNHAKSTA